MVPDGAKRASRKQMTSRTAPPIKQFAEADLFDLVSGRASARRGLEIDAGVGGDDLGDLHHGGGDRGIVVPRLQLRDD